MNRWTTLKRLVDYRDNLHKFYADETWDILRRGFKDKDWSGITSNWRVEQLSRKDTKKLVFYFDQQAEINLLLSKKLYFTAMSLQ